jgi:hypothetical protein
MTTRPYTVPSAWPFPGQRAAAATPAPRKPRRPKMIYQQRPEDCLLDEPQPVTERKED